MHEDWTQKYDRKIHENITYTLPLPHRFIAICRLPLLKVKRKNLLTLFLTLLALTLTLTLTLY